MSDNYKCFVAKIDKTVTIDKADNIHLALVLGEQVIVSKDWGKGKVGLFFTSDTQLSHDFLFNNNLYRDSIKNKDNTKKGFFDDNRRVRCQPFLGVRSEGFFCGVEALSYLTSDTSKLKVGDQFNEYLGTEVCKKYMNERTLNKLNKLQKKKTEIVETPMFHKHVDTAQFKHLVDKIEVGDILNFHSKRHGTSQRLSYSKVIRKPKTLVEKIKDRFGKFKRESWEYLVGTRNVVLYEDQYDKQGFHGSEQYRFNILEEVKPHLEKGMNIYLEVYGWANDKPIMCKHNLSKLKDKRYKKKYGDEVTYKYGCLENTCSFHIYRITYVNEQGNELDFTNEQLISWCNSRGLNSTLEVHPTMIYDGDKDKLTELVEELTERPDCLTEDYTDPSHISEGIIIRVDRGTQIPLFLKSKSFAFKVAEGIAKENDEVDLEEIS